MKKTLLFAFAAMASLSAGAANFTDIFNVRYDGKPLANGSTIYVSGPFADSVETEIEVSPITLPDIETSYMFGSLSSTGNPSYDMITDDPSWGAPTLCYESDLGGSCFMSSFTNPNIFGEGNATYDAYIKWQIHLVNCTTDKVSRYKLELNGEDNDGQETDDLFTVYIEYDPSGTNSVAGVVADDNAAECFDLQGRRIAAPARGLYIRDGKKVLVK